MIWAVHSLPFSAEVKNERNYTFTPPYVFFACIRQLYLYNILQESVLGLPGSQGNLKQTSVVSEIKFLKCT